MFFQMAVAPEVRTVWRNDRYEKCPESCELFANYNFVRTPRDNSPQNGHIRVLVENGQNYAWGSKLKGS